MSDDLRRELPEVGRLLLEMMGAAAEVAHETGQQMSQVFRPLSSR